MTVLKSVFGGACQFSNDCSSIITTGKDPGSVLENLDTVYSNIIKRVDLPAFGAFGVDYSEATITYNKFVYYLTITQSQSASFAIHDASGAVTNRQITRCEPTFIELTETGSGGFVRVTTWRLVNPITIQQMIATMAAKVREMQPTANTFSVLNQFGEPISFLGNSFNDYDLTHYRQTARLLDDTGRPWDKKQVASVYVGDFVRPDTLTVWQKNWGRSTVELIRTTTQTPPRYCVYETGWNVPSYSVYGAPYCISNLTSSPMTFEPIYRDWIPQHAKAYGRWMLSPGQSIAQLGIAPPACCQ